jgi:hypothetical protein
VQRYFNAGNSAVLGIRTMNTYIPFRHTYEGILRRRLYFVSDAWKGKKKSVISYKVMFVKIHALT